MKAMVRFFKEEEGATAMEYGLILGLAAMVVFIGIATFYGGLNQLFDAWGLWFSAQTPNVGQVGS